MAGQARVARWQLYDRSEAFLATAVERPSSGLIWAEPARPPLKASARRYRSGRRRPSEPAGQRMNQNFCPNLIAKVRGCAGMIYIWLSAAGTVCAKRDNWARRSGALVTTN